MKHKNYYEILEIDQNATSKEIKKAYYSLCKIYHPDINPKTANLFCNINKAYEILINPVTRREYDETLKEDVDFDINESFFEETTSHDDYYRHSMYYQTPMSEPLVNILNNFHQYRFENAIKAIWNRNILVLFGNTLVCALISSTVLFNRICKIFKKTIIPKKQFNSAWITFIIDSTRENTLFRFICWFFFMSGISTLKTICVFGKILFFIYTKILKALLLPISIIIAAFIHSRPHTNSYR